MMACVPMSGSMDVGYHYYRRLSVVWSNDEMKWSECGDWTESAVISRDHGWSMHIIWRPRLRRVQTQLIPNIMLSCMNHSSDSHRQLSNFLIGQVVCSFMTEGATSYSTAGYGRL